MSRSSQSSRKPAATKPATAPEPAAPASVPANQMSAEQIAGNTLAWDNARQELASAGAAAATAQTAFDALGEQSSDDDRQAANQALADARDRVAKAQKAIEALVPETAKNEADAGNTAIAAAPAFDVTAGGTLQASSNGENVFIHIGDEATGAAVAAQLAKDGVAFDPAVSEDQPQGEAPDETPNNTPPSEAMVGGTGDTASPAAEKDFALDRTEAQLDMLRQQLQSQLVMARELVASGQNEAGMAFLQRNRDDLTAMIALAAEFVATLDGEIAALSDEQSVGEIVEVKAKVDSRWRVGRHFTRTAVKIPRAELTDKQFLALDTDPLLSVTVK